MPARLRRLGGLALVSLVIRIVGFGSQVLVTTRFGASADLDAFLIALIAPALIWTPLASAMELALAPRYAAIRANLDDARRFRSVLVRNLAVAGLATSAIAVVFARFIVTLSAPGAGGARLDLAADLALIIYAGLGLRLVSGGISSVMIGAGHLTSPVVAKVVNPVALALAVATAGADATALATASLVGDALELVILLTMLIRAEGGLSWPSSGPALFDATFRRLTASQALVSFVPAIDQAFVSGLQAGALTMFVLASRLADVARSVIILPNARLVALDVEADAPVRRTSIREAYRSSVVAGVVAAAGVAMVGPLLLWTVFRRGALDAADLRLATWVTLALAPSMIASSLTYVQPRLAVMLGRSSSVAWLMAVLVTANVVLDAVLVKLAGAPGVAIASTAALCIVAWLFARVIRRAVDGAGS